MVNLGNDTAICQGANITLNAGNAGATYIWSNGATTATISASIAGNYHVAVTNAAGCVTTDTINITTNPVPMVNLGNDTTICAGNTLTLNAGNTGATYLWSNGATTQNISVSVAGDYSVTVTNALGCSATDAIQVSVSPLPVVNLGNDTAICQGANITLNAGNAGATYLWGDGTTGSSITVNTAGTYYVAVMNTTGCLSTDTIVMAINALPELNLGNDTAICDGSTLVLNAGNPGASYIWSTGEASQTINVNAAGTYTLSLTGADGCTASDEIEVTISPLPVADGINVSGASPAFTFSMANAAHINQYQWNFGDGQTASSGNPSHTYNTGSADQEYTVTLIISNDCGSDTLTTSVTVAPAGIKDLNIDERNLKLYPNPGKNAIHIENESKYHMKALHITNALGQELQIRKTAGRKETLDISTFANGLYYIIIEFDEGRTIRKFEVIQ
ncbi:PKD domain protein [compost metagenome]